MITYLAIFGLGVLVGTLSNVVLLVLIARFKRNLPTLPVVNPERGELKSAILDDDHAFEVENSR